VKLVNELVVPMAPEDAWAVLLDVERIAPCLPGANVEAAAEGEFRGTMAVKLGPIISRFEGTLRIGETDAAAGRAVLHARAREGRGQGTAAATITSTIARVTEGPRVVVETDLHITGVAAQFGRGVMQDTSAKLMARFAECLAAEMGRSGGAGDGAGTRSRAAASSATTAGEAGTPLAAALPSDVPPPPPAPEGGVRWPDGVLRPPGELPGGAAPPVVEPSARPSPEVLDLGVAGREAVLVVGRRALTVAVALGAAALAVEAVRRRRRR
jgi:carbon monoxide dehydrogenase subunit G